MDPHPGEAWVERLGLIIGPLTMDPELRKEKLLLVSHGPMVIVCITVAVVQVLQVKNAFFRAYLINFPYHCQENDRCPCKFFGKSLTDSFHKLN
jgi:hypothetical protein